VEQCRKSESAILRSVAFSEKTCLDFFTFYIEWNERHQHKSMRQALELSSILIIAQPDKSVASTLRQQILDELVAIIIHQGPQPLVKPAFKALECYITKASILPADIVNVHSRRRPKIADGPAATSFSELDSLVSSVFEWMTLPDISPGAGKFLVSFFRELRKDDTLTASKSADGLASLWKRWIHTGLGQHPESLENIQRHLFPPLFKMDRAGSVAFLQELTDLKSLPHLDAEDFDADAFLLLAAMEVGKKYGLVEEPGMLKPCFTNNHS
jgi:hypothetical protein